MAASFRQIYKYIVKNITKEKLDYLFCIKYQEVWNISQFYVYRKIMNNEKIISYKDIDKSCNIVGTLPASSILCKNNQRYSTDQNMLEEKDTKKVHTRARACAQTYLEDKQISKLFNFLIGHLLVEESPDPIQYLEKLLKECILYRSGVKKPPLLFKTRHIRSIFRSLDPDDYNTISVSKYTTGMIILGIFDYEPNPFECIPGHVDWHTFKKEARRCLDKALDDMIGKKRNDIS